MAKNEKKSENKSSGFKAFAAVCVAKSKVLWRFLTQDVWDVDVSTLPFIKRQWAKLARIVTLVWRGFRQDECALHASSLTFMTLLSFVPVFALGISLVKAVSYDATLRDKTKEFVREWVMIGGAADAANSEFGVRSAELTNGAADAKLAHEAVNVELGARVAESGTEKGEHAGSPLQDAGVSAAQDADDSALRIPNSELSSSGMITVDKIEEMIDVGFDKVEMLNFGALGGVGLVLLIWAVISVLGKVEAAFNRVWGVVENRRLMRKIIDYLGVLIIFPLLGVAASSLPVVNMLNEKMNEADSAFFLSHIAGFPVVKVVWVLFLLTLAFTFLLRFTPNTHVRLLPALVGGFCVAAGFAGWLKLCMALQIGVAKYSAFFGSFAMVPIILSWVYVSWEIILAGVEVSYAIQSAETYRMEHGWHKANMRARILLAVAMLREAAHELTDGSGLLDIRAFNKRYHVSVRLVRDVAHELVNAGVLVETAEDPDFYAVRRDVESFYVSDVVKILMSTGTSPDTLGITALATSRVTNEELLKALNASSNTRLRDLPLNAEFGMRTPVGALNAEFGDASGDSATRAPNENNSALRTPNSELSAKQKGARQ